MGHRRTGVLVGLAALFASTMPGGHAAGPGTGCRFELDLHANPGLGPSPTSGTISTNGEGGTVTCDGPVSGRRPTGPGTIGVDGLYRTARAFSCHDDGQGEDLQTITIPTSDGPQRVANRFTYRHGAYQKPIVFKDFVMSEGAIGKRSLSRRFGT